MAHNLVIREVYCTSAHLLSLCPNRHSHIPRQTDFMENFRNNCTKQALTLVFSCCFTLLAVQGTMAQRHEAGISLGGTNFKGDLSHYPNILATRPGAELFFRYNFNDAVSWRTGVFGGFLYGNDSLSNNQFQQIRAYSFKSTVLELNTVLEYHFLSFLKWRSLDTFSPYLFGGIGGMAYFNTEWEIGESNPHRDQAPDQAPPLISPVIPYGVGIKFLVSPKLILGVEYGTRQTFSDLFDRLSAAEDNTPKFVRDNPFNSDKYYYLSVSLSYRFIRVRCPEPTFPSPTQRSR